jgi:hypothetical protein
MARIVQYYTEYSKAMPLVCDGCGWSGPAKEACMEMYDDLFDLECPTCLKMLLIVPYPTGEQTRAA